MASDTSSGQDESSSTVKLLGKCFGVGLVLGIVGMAIFLGLLYGANITLSLVGLVPPFLAGLGVSMVAGSRGGVLTGIIAVITGQGPVLLMYGLLFGLLGGASLGRGDIVVIMFGFVIAYKMGTGTDEESTDEGTTETPSDHASEGGAASSADVDTEAVAEALEGEDADLDDLADALEAEESADEAAPPAGAPAASDVDGGSVDDGESAADGESGDEDGTASDWVNDD